MAKVIQLPDNLIRQIAAGEVIAEPLSVVKEAIENSIDAGASDIQVDIKNGGLTSITIADNGSGITKEDLLVITTRHSTSKIKTEADLVKVLTLGFRGEFLASLLAAADLRIITKEEHEEQAYKAFYTIGSLPQIEPASRTIGTTIQVNNLFDRIPARRNFLPKPKTSMARIHELIRQFSLAYPKLRLTFHADDREIFRSQPGEKLNAITMVLGAKTAKNLLQIAGKSDDQNWEVSGFISKPVEIRATRSSEYFFVNGRIIENSVIQKALEDGYSNFLAPHKFPIAVLYFKSLPDEFDANVHPAKKEIRIKHENAVYQFIVQLVYSTLTQATNNSPSSFQSPPAVTQQSFEPHFSTNSLHEDREKAAKNRLSMKKHSPLFKQEHHNSISNNHSRDDFESEEEPNTPERIHPLEDSLQYFYDRADITHIGDENFIHVINKEEIKDLEPIFQFNKTFIIAVNKLNQNNLYLIDQHAVAERIALEDMIFERKKIVKQKLLEPFDVDLTPEEYNLFSEIRPIMSRYGYTIDLLDNLQIRIVSLPLYQNKKLSKNELVFNLREIISDGVKIKKKIQNISDIEEDILKSLACHNSIRAGDILSKHEMIDLLIQMSNAKFPFVCCHGRPSVFKLPLKRLHRLFWRN